MFNDQATCNLSEISDQLTLPLTRPSQVAQFYLVRAAAEGVLVFNAERFALLAHDLQTERWSVAHGKSPSVVEDGSLLWHGVSGGFVRCFDYRTGAEVRRFPGQRELGGVCGRVGAVLLMHYIDDFVACDERGRELWRRERNPRALVVSTPTAFVVAENSRRELVCLDAETGVERWRVQTTPSHVTGDAAAVYELLPGLPSVSCVSNRVIVIRNVRDILVLDLDTGERVAQAESDMPGLYLVSSDHIYFFSAAGLLVYDHRRMEPVERLDLSGEIAAMYGKAQPAIRGFTVTQQSIFWTAPEGILMGLSRQPDPDGHRLTWTADVGGVSPIFRSPTVSGNYLYWERAAVPPEQPRILCFQGSSLG